MPTILSTPLPALNFARNKVIAEFYNNTTAPSSRSELPSAEIQIWIENTYNSGTFSLVSELVNPYNLNTESVKFNLSKALLSCFSPSLPDMGNSGIQPFPGVVKRFLLKARDIVSGIPEGDFTETATFHALFAGTSIENGSPDLSGKAYVFLSTRKQNRRVHNSEILNIQFLPLTNGTPTVTITSYTNASTSTIDVVGSPVTAYQAQSLLLEIPNRENLKKIEVTISGLSGTTETLVFESVSHFSEDPRQLFYLNSMGGFESVSLMGKSEFSTSIQADIFEQEPSSQMTPDTGNSIAFNQSLTETMIIQAGIFKRADLKNCMDIPLRNLVWLYENSTFKKIIISPETYSTNKIGEDIHSLSMKARFAYSNHSI